MLNKIQIIGRLGKDPELRYTPAGQPVATFPVASTEKMKDAQGQAQEITEWHNVVVWANLAENCTKYLNKGKLVFVEGKVKTRSWDDKQTGQKQYRTEVVANNVIFLTPSDGAQQRANPQGYAQAAQQASKQAIASQQWGTQNTAKPPANDQSNYKDHTPMDDIPF